MPLARTCQGGERISFRRLSDAVRHGMSDAMHGRRTGAAALLCALALAACCPLLLAQPAPNGGPNFSAAAVCVVIVENRLGPVGEAIVGLPSMDALYSWPASHRAQVNETTFRINALLINKAYTLAHGYRLLLSNGSAYRHVRADMTWKKVWAMRDVLADGSCSLVVSLDSDAYFHMAYHKASVVDLLQHASVEEHTYGFAAIEEERTALGRYASWATNRSLFIATNGAAGGAKGVPYVGYPHEFLNPRGDYVCTGVYIMRNTNTSRQLLNDWTKLLTDDNRNKNLWEQKPMNRVLFPRYREHAVVFPFETLTSTSGLVRHFWRPLADVRDKLTFRDLLACIPGFVFA